MKRRVGVGLLLLAAVAIVVAWFAWPRPATVEILTLKNAPAERVLAVNGRLRPRLSVEVRPSIGGEIVALPFDVGDRVAAGQVIARLDDKPETAAIAQARASVAAQRAVLAQARRDMARFEALGQFVTRREVEQRRLAVDEGARELARLQALVTQLAETRERRVLRAPFAGVILDRPVDPGQTVSPDSVIYRLADLSDPETQAEIDEIYAAEIRPGMVAQVRFPGSERSFQAEVIHVEPLVDAETGARDVRLRTIATPAEAVAGMTVSVSIAIERRDRAISIPRGAIVQRAGQSFVRIVDSQNRIRERRIEFIEWPADRVIIRAGLSSSDRILADPEAAAPGEKVRAGTG